MYSIRTYRIFLILKFLTCVFVMGSEKSPIIDIFDKLNTKLAANENKIVFKPIVYAAVKTMGKNLEDKRGTIQSQGSDVSVPKPEDQFLNRTEELSNDIQSKIFKDPLFDISILREYLSYSRNILFGSICPQATILTGYFFTKIRSMKASEADVYLEAMQLCNHILVQNKITTTEVCVDFLEQFIQAFFFIAREKPRVTASVFVATFFQQEGCTSNEPLFQWDVEIPNADDTFLTKIVEPEIESPQKYTKIIQLSDIHIDPYYSPGSSNECPEKYLCCRSSSGDPNKPENVAGYYGDIKICNSPWSMLNKTLKHIAKTHPDVKLIYFTGNGASVNSWNNSRESVSIVVTKVIQTIREFLPKAELVFSLGVYDVYPIYLFTPNEVKSPRLSTNYIYNVTINAINWLQEGQQDNILQGLTNFKDILHSQVNWNFYLQNDPSGQLEWLVKELQASEDSGQFVHIISGVPLGHSACDSVYSRNFYKILKRYKYTVQALWCGHTRNDEFKLFYDSKVGNENLKPIIPMFFGGSLSSYRRWRKHNNVYKIYYVDGERQEDSTWKVFNWETCILDLEKVNKNPNADFEFTTLYSAKQAYGIANTLPVNLDKLVRRFIHDSSLFELYYKLYFKLTNDDIKENCDEKCKKMTICSIVQSYYGENEICKWFNVAVFTDTKSPLDLKLDKIKSSSIL